MRKIIIFLLSLLILSPGHSLTLINDTETESMLTELVAPLASAAKIPANRMKIHIVNDDDFNAFVRGGEDIFI